MTEHRDYLEARHAGWRTPKDALSALVRRAAGKEAVAFERVVEGNNNEVYVVRTDAQDQYITRITHAGESGASEEAWCLRTCADAGVPVPEVLAAESIEIDGVGFDAMVLTKLPGAPLSDILGSLSSTGRAHAWNQMGTVLRRIHSIRVDGFYKRDQDGKWDFPDWRAFAESNLDSRTEERPFLLDAGFDENDVTYMLEMIRRYGDEFDCAEPVLCHGDFLPEHVFFDESLNVTGVIDFGLYQGNHAIHDFAIVAMDYGIPEVRLLQEGYGHRDILDDRFDVRLHLHLVPLEIGFLAHVMKTNQPSVQEHVRGLRRTIAWLRDHGS